jgi:8-oxo-dGTP diphosphatase
VTVHTPQLVVGAVILDDPSSPVKVLAARRATGTAESIGRWEFPGGKVEPGESPTDAVRRELKEELAVEAIIDRELGDGRGWEINDRLVLRLFVAHLADDKVVAGPDHDAVRWLSADDVDSTDWLPSDRAALPLVRKLLGGQPGRFNRPA